MILTANLSPSNPHQRRLAPNRTQMATAAIAKPAKESIFEWEGKDRNGKVVRGEMRAGGEAVVNASLRR